jgi:hypothetical protein
MHAGICATVFVNFWFSPVVAWLSHPPLASTCAPAAAVVVGPGRVFMANVQTKAASVFNIVGGNLGGAVHHVMAHDLLMSSQRTLAGICVKGMVSTTMQLCFL